LPPTEHDAYFWDDGGYGGRPVTRVISLKFRASISFDDYEFGVCDN